MSLVHPPQVCGLVTQFVPHPRHPLRPPLNICLWPESLTPRPRPSAHRQTPAVIGWQRYSPVITLPPHPLHLQSWPLLVKPFTMTITCDISFVTICTSVISLHVQNKTYLILLQKLFWLKIRNSYNLLFMLSYSTPLLNREIYGLVSYKSLP